MQVKILHDPGYRKTSTQINWQRKDRDQFNSMQAIERVGQIAATLNIHRIL